MKTFSTMSIPILEITIASYQHMYSLLEYEIDSTSNNVDQRTIDANLQQRVLLAQLIAAAENRLKQLQN